jgi:glycosyltransferase involved in cell wall biosynthesis/peptidoglycan/xylan/chitin deacetylase (PgdA/CDA1 family)
VTETARNYCLHYVTEARGERRLAMSDDELRAVVVGERHAGRTSASLADYVTSPPAADRFTLSFDDAHRSVLERAAPVLSSLAERATLFVATAWIGTSREWLDWDGVRRLRDLGWTIGAHSVTHPRMSWALYDETPARHAQRLRDECERSRDVIARALGAAPTLFAYPYGEDPAIAREAVRAAGFGAAFTVRESGDWDGDRLSIPRVDGMEASGLVKPQREPLGISVVVPAHDRTEILGEVLSRLAAQSYDRERHEMIVVDDGSKEDLSPFLPKDDPRFRLLRNDTDGRFRAGQARARGASEARHPILAFLDADVAVGKDFLWSLDWVHSRWPRTALFGYLSGYNLHDLGHLHTLAQVRGVDPIESVPVIPDRQREPVARACLDNIDWIGEPWRLCYTGNLSLPRSLFDEVSGFSDAFTGWGLEDVDLGYRLHAAKASFVFSRFALGYHLVDPTEPAPRNPFRKQTPQHEDFAGYLENLEILRTRHGADPAMRAYVEHTLTDIEETCSRPSTVGIEFGGAAERKPPFHAELHRIHPGGVPTEELLDRVEYATKIGARRLWLCGGEPAEHPGFLHVLEEAHRRGLKTGLETMGHPFDIALAERVARLGVNHVTLLVMGFSRERHDALIGDGAWARFEAGVEALRAAKIHLSAHLVWSGGDEAAMAAYELTLRAKDIAIDTTSRVAGPS